MMTSTSLRPPARVASSLSPLIAKDSVLMFSGVLLPLGRTQCLRAARRLLHDSDDGAGSSASARKSKRHNSELTKSRQSPEVEETQAVEEAQEAPLPGPFCSLSSDLVVFHFCRNSASVESGSVKFRPAELACNRSFHS
ncbi:hypothetical protein JG688_00017424 [Phytophthora aleatoria]|uniref:Uncharacterized protein n=1 Tax=Phytophthora aleatoria TaxID=2496075 RepID=A0A8J5ICH3_9STRA|nr:hypothetical protein JG688_00017424 [Phytophthora aleatoria]